jgi:hypothetical protein
LQVRHGTTWSHHKGKREAEGSFESSNRLQDKSCRSSPFGVVLTKTVISQAAAQAAATQAATATDAAKRASEEAAAASKERVAALESDAEKLQQAVESAAKKVETLQTSLIDKDSVADGLAGVAFRPGVR